MNQEKMLVTFQKTKHKLEVSLMKYQINPSVVGKTLPKEYHVSPNFKIFRFAQAKNCKEEPKAWFIVKFTLKNMDVKKNESFSKIPMRVLFHFKGFYSKYWLMDKESNTCMGVYRWQTKADAEHYSRSIAMKFMKMPLNK